MARRMFNDEVVQSDRFLDQPHATICLYFILMMHTDDYGFVDNPTTALRIINATKKDLNLLVTNGFVFKINPGLVLIRHFPLQNTIRADRIKPSKFMKYLKNYTTTDAGVYQKTTQGNLFTDQK